MEYNTVVPPTSFTNNTQQDKEKYFRQYINGEEEAVCNHYRKCVRTRHMTIILK